MRWDFVLGAVFACTACAGSRAPAPRLEPPTVATPTATPSTSADAGVARADASAGDEEWHPQTEQEQRFLEMETAAVARLREKRVALLSPSQTRADRGVLPANWKTFDAILLRRTWLPKGVDSEALAGVEIFWSSPSIDGRVALVLTDEQIYLRSGHDNPHHNHVYWVMPATPAQRSTVSDFLALQRKKHVQQGYDCDRSGTSTEDGTMSCFVAAAFPEQANASAARHVELTAKNAAAVIGRLNKLLPTGVPPLPVPAASELSMKVLVSQMADELSDWLGR